MKSALSVLGLLILAVAWLAAAIIVLPMQAIFGDTFRAG